MVQLVPGFKTDPRADRSVLTSIQSLFKSASPAVTGFLMQITPRSWEQQTEALGEKQGGMHKENQNQNGMAKNRLRPADLQLPSRSSEVKGSAAPMVPGKRVPWES